VCVQVQSFNVGVHFCVYADEGFCVCAQVQSFNACEGVIFYVCAAVGLQCICRMFVYASFFPQLQITTCTYLKTLLLSYTYMSTSRERSLACSLLLC